MSNRITELADMSDIVQLDERMRELKNLSPTDADYGKRKTLHDLLEVMQDRHHLAIAVHDLLGIVEDLQCQINYLRGEFKPVRELASLTSHKLRMLNTKEHQE